MFDGTNFPILCASPQNTYPDLLLPYLSTSSPQISQEDHDTAVNSLNEEISNLNQLKELYIKRLKYLYMKIDQLKA